MRVCITGLSVADMCVCIQWRLLVTWNPGRFFIWVSILQYVCVCVSHMCVCVCHLCVCVWHTCVCIQWCVLMTWGPRRVRGFYIWVPILQYMHMRVCITNVCVSNVRVCVSRVCVSRVRVSSGVSSWREAEGGLVAGVVFYEHPWWRHYVARAAASVWLECAGNTCVCVCVCVCVCFMSILDGDITSPELRLAFG